MKKILEIIKNPTLTFEQKVNTLAKIAENSIEPIILNKEEQNYINHGIIDALYEGNTPYRPRYICVDFQKFINNGCKFLELKTPTNIWEATNNLLIFYKHIPSITNQPVYLGNIDTLLNPFIKNEDEAYMAIKLFLNHIDKTITDSFCHANIGPTKTKAGELILKAMKEFNNPTPNLTLKYNENTPEDFANLAIETALVTAKPSFANDNVFRSDFNGEYAIASCYNGLKIGGGAHTLVRVVLSRLSEKSENINDFFNIHLPNLVKSILSIMDKRIKFIVEESDFFKNNFLVKENFINLNNFSAMFGLVGLAECVDILIKPKNTKESYGYSKTANDLGKKIIKIIYELVEKHNALYSKGTNNKYLLHAQVGLNSDIEITPGVRIPIGKEPDILTHIMQSAPFHKYFKSGIGDIYVFDQTYKNNTQSILDIINGAFKNNLRYFSLYSKDSDVIRISGYLVKRSEIDKFKKNKAVLRDTTFLGKGGVETFKILNRKVQTNE